MLDTQPQIISLVERNLLSKDVKPTGRKALSVESIFRCMLLKQIIGTDYRELSFLLSDSQTYRTFAKLDRDCYPGKSALCKNIRRLRPRTLGAVFGTLAIEICEAGVMDTALMRFGSKLIAYRGGYFVSKTTVLVTF